MSHHTIHSTPLPLCTRLPVTPPLGAASYALLEPEGGRPVVTNGKTVNRKHMHCPPLCVRGAVCG